MLPNIAFNVKYSATMAIDIKKEEILQLPLLQITSLFTKHR